MIRRLGKQCLQQLAHCSARSALLSEVQRSAAAAAAAAAAAVNLPVYGRNSALCWHTSPLIHRLGGIAAFGSCASSFAAHSGYTALNTLSDNPGAVRKVCISLQQLILRVHFKSTERHLQSNFGVCHIVRHMFSRMPQMTVFWVDLEVLILSKRLSKRAQVAYSVLKLCIKRCYSLLFIIGQLLRFAVLGAR
jgi:hypothetical protein